MVDHAEMRAAYLRALDYDSETALYKKILDEERKLNNSFNIEKDECQCYIGRNFETGKAFVKVKCVFCEEQELILP